MGLSHDIISEFVKITNDNKEKQKEGIVYATIVQASDGKYVKIDGSDLLTPTNTTTDIEDGERVTVMIKDHTATVTGNVSSPSASSNRVDKVVNTVSEQIGAFELVVADKVSTNELEAYKATIENLIVGKAEIEDLEATNAIIENLKVKDAEIENAIIDKATIEDLEAVNAKIENLEVKDAEIENAVIDNLEATKAEIKILNADFAQIKTLVSGNLTSDNILSFNITADKVTMEDAFIKDAMIDTISAAKINTGQINTDSVIIGSEDGGMCISGATQQFTDKNGNVRIQIGRDASDDFTFALYGEDGQGQIINQNGITASAIADGLIVNDMVSDNAAISGGKLDISSVVTEINNDNTTTINSNKIYLDEQNQSLEVAFKSLKTQVDTIKDIDSDLTTITDKIQSNTSKIEANKSSISTLLAEDAAIKKQVTDLEGNVVETTNTLTSKYTSLQQNLDGFKTTVNNTYATKSSVNDVKNNLSANYSTTSAMNSAINQKVDEITASISSTYATKNEVKTIDDNIKTNYSTTEQMESAISVAKNEINLGVSQVYETKTNVQSKIDDIQIGGRNLITKHDNNLKNWTALNYPERFEITNDDYNNTLNFKTLDGGWEVIYKEISVTPNKEYVLSFEYSVLTDYNYFKDNRFALNISSTKPTNSSPVYDLGRHVIENKVTGLKRVSLKFTPTTNKIYLVFNGGCINDGQSNIKFNFNKFKLEKGTIPTDYTVAPEDITTDIGTAKNDAITSANNTLNTTIANYYTKTQTDSAIKVAKDAIDLSVKNTYETKTNVQNKIEAIQVGGRNLVKKSATLNNSFSQLNTFKGTRTVVDDSTAKSGKHIKVECTTAGTGFYVNIWSGDDTCVGKQYTWSFYAKSNRKWTMRGIGHERGGRKDINVTTEWQKFTHTWIYSSSGNRAFTFYPNFEVGDILYIKDLQIEEGNKSTDWSPAPEDVTSDITQAKNDAITSANRTLTSTIANYYTKTQTDSQINVAKDAINLGVSQTYETKTNVTSKVNSAISTASSDATTKANNALTSAKSYADTKKSEAITSANNTLNTTIANYYTKTQTDSAIKVAKDAIDLSVKNTYETKTEVSNKINAIKVGGTNLLGGTATPKVRSVNKSTGYDVYDTYFTNGHKTTLRALGFKANDELSVSFDWSISKNGSLAMVYGNFRAEFMGFNSSNTDGQYVGVIKNPVANFSSSNTSGRFEGAVKLTEAMLGAYCLRIRTDNSVLTLTISNAKWEKGNKVTSWCPSPKDITSDISNAQATAISESKKYADSQIKIAKDSITSSVSSTYETKTNVQNKIDTISVSSTNLIDNSAPLTTSGWAHHANTSTLTTSTAIESTTDSIHGKCMKVTFTGSGTGEGGRHKSLVTRLTVGKTYSWSVWLKCSKSMSIHVGHEQGGLKTVTVGTSWTYVTHTFTANDRKYEAFIIRPTATAGDYFHFHSVMITESTKPMVWLMSPTETQNNISNVETRINTAEQKITDTAITNVVKQKFYTKEETNNQITSKGYQTASQVQQTVDNLQIKFTGGGGYNLLRNGEAKNGKVSWDPYHLPNCVYNIRNDNWTNYDPCFELHSSYAHNNQNAIVQVVQRLEIGQTYTVSALMAGHRASYAIVIVNESDTQVIASSNIITDAYGGPYAEAWGNAVVTFKATETICRVRLVMVSANSDNGFMWAKKVQMVKGSIPLAYTSHPNEVYDGITTIDKDGITVDSTNVNTKTQMDANGFKVIRKSDGKELFNASNGNLNMEGVLKTGTSGKFVEMSNSNYKVYDGLTQKGFFGLATNDVWTNVPKIYMGTRGVGDSYEFRGYDFFSIQAYEEVANPGNTSYAYTDIAYYTKNHDDYSNIKLNGDGTIRLAPLSKLTITSNYSNGVYAGKSERYLAEFGTSPYTNLYNAYLDIGAIINLDRNNNGLILEHTRSGVGTAVRVHTDSSYNKTFRPCDANADIYLGTSGYKWKAVYASNGSVQTSDERYKMKMGYLDTDDCYEMVKNTALYKYCMLPKSKERMSEVEIRKVAKISSDQDIAIQTGIMAQEILDYSCSKYILTHETWTEDDTGEEQEIYNINPYGFSTSIMGALKKEIEIRDIQYQELKSENEKLKNELAEIKKLLSNLIN